MLVLMDQVGSHFEMYTRQLWEMTESAYSKYFALAEKCNPYTQYVICLIAINIIEEHIGFNDFYSQYSPAMYAIAGAFPTFYFADRLSRSQQFLFLMIGCVTPLLSYVKICQSYLRPIYGFYVMLPCLERVFTLNYAVISFYFVCVLKGLSKMIFVGMEEECYFAVTTSLFFVFGTSKSRLGRMMLMLRFLLYGMGSQDIFYVHRYHRFESKAFPPISRNEAILLFLVTTMFAYVMVECIQLNYEDSTYDTDQTSYHHLEYTDSEVEDRSYFSTGSEIIEDSSTDTLHSDFLPQEYRLHVADMRQTKRFIMHSRHPQCGRQCAICHQKLRVNESCREIKICVHVFHADCIEPWFRMNMKCPLCKREVRNPFTNENQDVSNRKPNNQCSYRVLSYQMTIGETV